MVKQIRPREAIILRGDRRESEPASLLP